jgi:hypothetical protein
LIDDAERSDLSASNEQKFFGSFFQKRTASYLHPRLGRLSAIAIPARLAAAAISMAAP